MNVEIKPFVAEVDDYHEFESIKQIFSSCGIALEFEEIGFFNYYQAVFWVAGDEEAAFEFMMTDRVCLAFVEDDDGWGESEPRTPIDVARREIAKRAGDVAKREVEDMEKKVANEEKWKQKYMDDYFKLYHAWPEGYRRPVVDVHPKDL